MADEETLRRIVEALSAAGNPPAAVDVAGAAAGAGLSGRRPANAGCWRCSFTGCGRGATGATAISAISRRCWTSSPISAARGIGLNPLHAQFYDRPGCSGSPYSPNSRLFLNPLYIDVEAIEEFDRAHAASLPADIARLRDAELVDYPAVATREDRGLCARRIGISSRTAARSAAPISPPIGRSAAAPLECFAAFETLRQKHSGAWWEWPEQWRQPQRRRAAPIAREPSRRDRLPRIPAMERRASARTLPRHRAAARECRSGSISTPRSASIGGGADAWMDQDVVLRGLSVGAPPDQFNPAGQDWGITAYNPHGLVARRFEPFRQMLRAAMRYAGAVRIDHVLGLMRLYVIPHGLGAAQGRVSAPAVRRHAGGGRRGKPALELHRHRRGPRHRAGGLPRHALGLGRVVLSRRDVRAELGRLVPPAGGISRARHRDLQHPRPCDLRRLDDQPRSADQARHQRRSRRDRGRPAQFARDACARRSRRRPAASTSASRTSPLSSARRRRGLSRSRSKTCLGWRIRSTCPAP